ncbi:MAG: hypothetical protein RL398_1525 [Planctomycetota bacterium]
MGMKSPRAVLFSALVAGLVACGTPSTKTVDFAKNPKILADQPFVTGRPGDRAVFLAPVADLRSNRMPTREGAFPVVYAPDAAWDRPIAEMVGEVLSRELGESGVFGGLLDRATPDAVVIQPQLVSFCMGTIENLQGARTVAEFAVNLKVYGPAGADGERPLWFERLYGDRQVTEPQLVPDNMFFVAGSTIARSVTKMMVSLDGTNVGRHGVPLHLGNSATTGTPGNGIAEASAPGR